MKVFIVILNWNRAKDTLDCLRSIEKLSIINYQLSIVVVDNGSTDNSVSLITRNTQHETKKQINFKIIKNKANLGFAGGNNVGIRHALDNGADSVVILNNDTAVDNGLIEGLLKTAEQNKDAGVISPKIYFAKGYEFHKDRYDKSDLGKVIWYAGGKMDWDTVYGSNRGVDEIDRGQYDEVTETDFATGACMFLKSETLKKV